MNVIRKTKCETCGYYNEKNAGRLFWENVETALKQEYYDVLQKEISARLPEGYYDYYKRGEILPNPEIQTVIAKLFGLEAEDLREQKLKYRALNLEFMYLREKKNYDIKKLSDATGINESNLRKFESGELFPNPNQMLKLQDFYKDDFTRLVNKYNLEEKMVEEPKRKIKLLRDPLGVPVVDVTLPPKALTEEGTPIVARNIDAAIKNSGMTLREISKATHRILTESNISEVRHGKAMLTPYKLYKLASALSTSPEMLCKGTENVGKKTKRKKPAKPAKEDKNLLKIGEGIDKEKFTSEHVFQLKNDIKGSKADSLLKELTSCGDENISLAKDILDQLGDIIQKEKYSPLVCEIQRLIINGYKAILDSDYNEKNKGIEKIS